MHLTSVRGCGPWFRHVNARTIARCGGKTSLGAPLRHGTRGGQAEKQPKSNTTIDEQVPGPRTSSGWSSTAGNTTAGPGIPNEDSVAPLGVAVAPWDPGADPGDDLVADRVAPV